MNGIDQDIKLNKALWLLGERMAALKVRAGKQMRRRNRRRSALALGLFVFAR
ncbi:hypothetical protein [Rhizobium leguminosarum]|uniref:hypothetical protein n=1 Tax=Rhizobium leguminosarum TaxID=384 RepID=UPI001FEF07A0|nr:hypothetical protein [Rhizobium leguminosarum]